MKGKLLTDEHDLKYFEELPETFKKASYTDFFNPVGELIPNIPYLVLIPVNSKPRYYAHRTPKTVHLHFFEHLVFCDFFIKEKE